MDGGALGPDALNGQLADMPARLHLGSVLVSGFPAGPRRGDRASEACAGRSRIRPSGLDDMFGTMFTRTKLPLATCKKTPFKACTSFFRGLQVRLLPGLPLNSP